MRFWALATGGLLVWAAHFLGLYLLSSAADVAHRDAGAWNGTGLVFSLICLIVVVGLYLHARSELRRRLVDDTRFGLALAAAGAGLGGIGVVFQTLVLLAPD
nr:hypothetical protein [uncultured Brevundimonas sp.]